MTQVTNLNISPYYDDFDSSKNYNRVLFKPGYPVQSRELTQLQTILQNQIEKFGQHFFKEGSMVIPGGTIVDKSYFAVRLDPTFLNIPVKNYTQYLADNKIEIKGDISGVTATVVNRITDVESSDNFDTLYVKYSGAGDDGVSKKFQDGERLVTLSDIEYANTKISANSQFAQTIISSSNKIGCSASISEGIFFIRGYFVEVPSSTIILDQYSNSPSYRIGLNINEEIVAPSLANFDLFDNAQGYSNETAPGADRFRISASLHKKLLTDTDDLNFVELIRIENGELKRHVNRTEYNIFKDELARRTYDESGDYYIRPFSVDVRESLNNRIANRGIYLPTQKTQNGNTPSDDLMTLQVSEGKAYVKGYEIDKISTSSVDVLKPRTSKSHKDVVLPIRIGNIATVENIFGSPAVGFDTSIKLLDRRTNAQRVSDQDGSVIGKARVYDFNPIGSANYQVRLIDIQTFTKVSLASTTLIAVNDQIEGKYSGSTGFVDSASSVGSVLTLSDVRGEFQINEPLIVNGIEIGSNIGTVRDYNYTDIKALHSADGIGSGTTTFAANLSLNRTSRVFLPNSEFLITAGDATSGISTITSSSVADFKTIVRDGDIISYNHAGDGNTIPTYARVNEVLTSEIRISTVTNVAGINNGGTLPSGNISPNEVDLRIPFLAEAGNTGLIIPFERPNVSSLNILNSSYIVRKKFNQTSSNFQLVLNLSSHGDDLSFEPFTEIRYVITRDSNGVRETLRAAQFAFSNNSRTLTISGLSANAAFTVTATVKRTRFSSIEKDITRCSSLVINRSNNSASGITTTSLNDGLTFSKVYGTRVQDKEISLNVPEIHRVLGVFESDDTTDPDIPSLTVSFQSDPFTNNVIVGEQLIGSVSGAVCRVVSIPSSTQLTFVYENDKSLELEESFTLQTSGIIGTISNIDSGDTNIIDNYILDQGQRAEYADYGRLIRDINSNEPTRKVRVIFDHYSRSGVGTDGTLESINSYSSLNYSNEIPSVDGRKASDFIDIRPRVPSYNTSSSVSPFAFGSRDFSNSPTESLVSNETMVVDYSHYLGRVDRLYLTKDGVFDIDKGEPSLNPKPPERNSEAFEVGVISLPPYVSNASRQVSVRLKSHKRFTMKDISGLEHRIRNLEEYTTLSLLETDTKNLSIKDPNTGLDKFKSGFFVDNFTNHKSHSFWGESNFDIDRERGECRPRSTERSVSLKIETKSSKASQTTADYRWIEDFEDSNITRNGQGLTLKFDEVEFLNQPLATRVENLNPYHIALYAGSLLLEPASDYWIEEIPLGTPAVFEDNSQWDAMASLYGVEDRENGGMAASYWNSHETTWSGREELVSTERLNEESNSTSTRTREHNPHGDAEDGNAIRDVTTTTTNTKWTEKRTFQETGTERTFGFEVTPEITYIDLGKKVVGTDIIHNCRSRNIEVNARRLKPNSQFYVFMDEVDITEYCTPKLLQIEMIRGSFSEGDIIESNFEVGIAEGDELPNIIFRAAKQNHKSGPFADPKDTQKTEPYNKTKLTSKYSSTSKILNIDTASLAMEVEPDQLGWVRRGMDLSNRSGDAECQISALVLMSDERGHLTFSLHIPDPKIASNPKFTTGTNTIRLTTSPTNESQLDPGECSAEATYLASGIAEYTQEQILAIKSANVERKQIGNDRIVTKVREETENKEDVNTTTTAGDWYDPLAQSFLVESKYKDGIFITGGNLYFKSKDEKYPVTVQLRTMRDGSPTTTIVPFGEMDIDPDDVNLSDDSSAATPFKFPTPVYLQSGQEYALVLVAPTEKYNTFITRMGEEDLILKAISNQQPYLGSLFKSQNSSTWTASQYEDLKFSLNKAKFVTNTPASFIFYNNKITNRRILKNNPVLAYSKTQYVSMANTSTEFAVGNEIIQGTNTGRIVSIGGSVLQGTSGLTFETTTGVGLTPTSGSFDYTGIGASSITGMGTAITATVRVTNGSVQTITVTDGGNGYQTGDLLVLDQLGSTGTSVRSVVGFTSLTNYLMVNEIDKNFVDSSSITHIDGDGVNTIFDANKINSVVSDSIRNGFTLKIDHRNHGMHGTNNKVSVSGFKPDGKQTNLVEDITNDSTTITLEDATGFDKFEGATVGAANTGYLRIGKEIIGYNAAPSNNVINISTDKRGIDDSLISLHRANRKKVSKYEFNGISLRKINKVHNIDGTKDRSFNNYYLKLDDDVANKPFNRTKHGGGHAVRISQNVPFEAIDPRITMINPTGTNVAARIKTISGTSVSGNENSFTDKGYEVVSLNKMNILDDPRIVASRTNEVNLLNSESSFALELVLSSNREDVSPMIDLDSANIILISNLVNDEVSNYEEDSRPRIPGSDPNHAIYETQPISLEFPSNSFYVQFDGHREKDANFRVFYKLIRSDSDPEQQVYVPFNLDGKPDKVVNPNTTINAFSEYKYTAENLPQFDGYQIKVVMTSKDQSNPPRFKNFRVIALRSFDV